MEGWKPTIDGSYKHQISLTIPPPLKALTAQTYHTHPPFNTHSPIPTKHITSFPPPYPPQASNPPESPHQSAPLSPRKNSRLAIHPKILHISRKPQSTTIHVLSVAIKFTQKRKKKRRRENHSPSKATHPNSAPLSLSRQFRFTLSASPITSSHVDSAVLAGSRGCMQGIIPGGKSLNMAITSVQD